MSFGAKEIIDRARAGVEQLDIPQLQTLGILPDGGKKFFPVIGYPPLTMFRDMDQSALFDRFEQRPASPTIAYFHIPFCPSRCTFCHWITKTKSPDEAVDEYVDYLEKEMALYKRNMGVDKIPASSVLVGGGTPTYLTAKQMEKFFTAINTHFDLSGCTQFSMEAEPGTLLGDEGAARLKVMKEFNVDRISMGVQSFDDDVLRYMGRTHTGSQAVAAVEAIHKAGISNVMIDLIYAYPNQTPEMWVENLRTAASLDVAGWQLYRLRVKQHGDRQGRILKVLNRDPERFPTLEETYLMKYLGIMYSEELGYGEHQTRIFSKKKDEISHYLRDWCCALTDVVGIGVSSWSNLRGVFTLNVGDHDLEKYYDYVREGKVAVNRGKIRDRDDELRRSFILPLKNMKVSKAFFKEKTGLTVGEVFGEQIAWYKEHDLIAENNTHIWLTHRGRFFADEVSTQFFNPSYLPFPDVIVPVTKPAFA